MTMTLFILLEYASLAITTVFKTYANAVWPGFIQMPSDI